MNQIQITSSLFLFIQSITTVPVRWRSLDVKFSDITFMAYQMLHPRFIQNEIAQIELDAIPYDD